MMHNPLSEAEIHRVALVLARLALTPEQERQTRLDFEQILDHVDTLSAADGDHIPPTRQPVDSTPRHWREDEVCPSLPVDTALRMAPERLGDGFGVPKIIE